MPPVPGKGPIIHLTAPPAGTAVFLRVFERRPPRCLASERRFRLCAGIPSRTSQSPPAPLGSWAPPEIRPEPGKTPCR